MSRLYENSWAILIGIGKFAHPSIPVLSTTLNDVKKIKDILTKYCSFEEEKVITLLDENATSNNIRSLIDNELTKHVKDNDRVLIFYSGHGITRPPHGREPIRGYLTTYDADYVKNEINWTSILQMDEFVSFVTKNLKAKQMLFMLDCCFSGVVCQPPEYESQRENRCEQDMISAAKNKRSVQIYTAAARDETILASSGTSPPISVFTDSIERIIKNENPLNYPEKFISAHKLSKKVTMLVRETSIFLRVPQNPVYYFSNLDDQGEFVFRQFTDKEIESASKAQSIKFEPIEVLIDKSELVKIFADENLPNLKRYVESIHGFDYTFKQLQNTIYDFVRQHGEIKNGVEQIQNGSDFSKDEIFNYISDNLIGIGLAKEIFKPRFVRPKEIRGDDQI